MLNKYAKAFTLVEMLVALAVSSIIIIASYASYEMVATQYKKNMDVADMHTSGRAIMRIIERDIRMAGFEYRDKDAKITYGTISSPLTIKDSGNKCCDEVTVIYDYFDEDTKKAERIRIRYWAEPHTSNKGSRHRLYKQKDILGQNKKILAKPKLGTKDVMADYIEDLQIVNVEYGGNLYVIGQASSSQKIQIFDPFIKKQIGSFPTNTYMPYPVTMTIGSDGLFYAVGGRGGSQYIHIFDPVAKKRVGSFSAGFFVGNSAMVVGLDGLLYIMADSTNGTIHIIDPVAKKRIGSFSESLTSIHHPIMTTDSNGLLYVIGSGRFSRNIQIFDPVAQKRVGYFPTGLTMTKTMAVGSNGLLYTMSHSTPPTSQYIHIFDPVAKKRVDSFSIPSRILSPVMVLKNKRTGQESLVTINLTLRTKNQYGKDRQFKKKDYHAGNYKLDKTDKYKRDTFSSTVLVRNLAL